MGRALMPLDRATHSIGPSVCKDMQRESPLPFLLDLASSHASVRPGAFEVGREALQGGTAAKFVG